MFQLSRIYYLLHLKKMSPHYGVKARQYCCLHTTQARLDWSINVSCMMSNWLKTRCLAHFNVPNKPINKNKETLSHLFCTLISENQVLDKSRSVSNLLKISVPVHLNFFSVHLIFFFSLSPEFFSGLRYKSEKNTVDKLKKKSGLLKKNSGVQDLKFF